MDEFLGINSLFISQKYWIKTDFMINQEYKFNSMALVDSGADFSCIREGLIPVHIETKSL